MSKKPVKELKERTLKKLFTGYSRSDWAEALEVSTAAFDKWLQRGRIPVDKYALATVIRKTIDGGHLGTPLREIMATDSFKVLSLEATLQDKSRLNPHYYHHKVQNKSNTDDSGGSESLPTDLSGVSVDRLVDEIESRGWNVSLSRKQ